jgi:hypothetical protein
VSAFPLQKNRIHNSRIRHAKIIIQRLNYVWDAALHKDSGGDTLDQRIGV